MERMLNIHHIRVVKKFANLEPVKISLIEQFLTKFVSLPTAKKNIRQMIDMRLIELEKSEADKRIKLVEPKPVRHDLIRDSQGKLLR